MLRAVHVLLTACPPIGPCGSSSCDPIRLPFFVCTLRRPAASDTRRLWEVLPRGMICTEAIGLAPCKSAPKCATPRPSSGSALLGENWPTRRTIGCQSTAFLLLAFFGSSGGLRLWRGGRDMVWMRMSPCEPPVTTVHSFSCCLDTAMAVTAPLCPDGIEKIKLPSLSTMWSWPLTSARSMSLFMVVARVSRSLNGSHCTTEGLAFIGSCILLVKRTGSSGSETARFAWTVDARRAPARVSARRGAAGQPTRQRDETYLTAPLATLLAVTLVVVHAARLGLGGRVAEHDLAQRFDVPLLLCHVALEPLQARDGVVGTPAAGWRARRGREVGSASTRHGECARRTRERAGGRRLGGRAARPHARPRTAAVRGGRVCVCVCVCVCVYGSSWCDPIRFPFLAHSRQPRLPQRLPAAAAAPLRCRAWAPRAAQAAAGNTGTQAPAGRTPTGERTPRAG